MMSSESEEMSANVHAREHDSSNLNNGDGDGSRMPLKPEQIITSWKGFLRLKKDNLMKIMDNYLEDPHPNVFVTVVGPPQSGKSFLTNLIIHLGTNPDDGGWLEGLVKDGEFHQGFSFGSGASGDGKLFGVESEERVTSAVYLWPIPYLRTKANGDQVYVWILHYQISDISAQSINDMEAIENVLGLMCSRMLEIMDGTHELRVEKMRRFFTSQQNVISNPLPTTTCDSVVVVYCTEDAQNSPKVLSGEGATKWILNLGQTATENCESLLGELTHLNLTRIKKICKALHDKNGRFDEDIIKPLIRPLKTTVNTFLMEDDEIIAKKIQVDGEDQVLRAGKVVTFLEDCVNCVNQLNAKKLAALKNLKSVPLKKEKLSVEECQAVESEMPTAAPASPFKRLRISGGRLDVEEKSAKVEESKNYLPSAPPEEIDQAVVHESTAMETEDSCSTKSNEGSDEMDTTDVDKTENEAQLPDETKRLMEEEKKAKALERERQQQQHRTGGSDTAKDCLLTTAITQVKQMVRAQAFFFVNKSHNIHPENVQNFKQLFDYAYWEILKHNYLNVIDPLQWKQFCDDVRDGSIDDCYSYLSKIFDPVCQFNADIERQLQLNGYFAHETFLKMAKEIAKKCMPVQFQGGNDPDAFELISLAMNKLWDIHKANNLAVMESEKAVRQSMSQKAKAFYNEEMTRFLQENGAFTKSEFAKIHHELVKKLLEPCREIANPGGAVHEDAKEWLVNLEKELNDAFVEHKKSNDSKLVMLLKQISKLVSARYDEYVEKMEKILQENPGGYDSKKLEKAHKSLSKGLQHSLENEVRTKIRCNEPTEGYCEALLHQINQYWKTVVEANEENLEKRKRSEKTKFWQTQLS